MIFRLKSLYLLLGGKMTNFGSYALMEVDFMDEDDGA